MTPLGNLIHQLLDYTDHPVVETYLMAFVGYLRDVESATRDDILQSTLHYDVQLSIKLHEIGVEFFDENGDLIPTPDSWKAQQLLGFESTYHAASLQEIIADCEQYEHTPELWPWYRQRCHYCGGPEPMKLDSVWDATCPVCIPEGMARP